MIKKKKKITFFGKRKILQHIYVWSQVMSSDLFEHTENLSIFRHEIYIDRI